MRCMLNEDNVQDLHTCLGIIYCTSLKHMVQETCSVGIRIHSHKNEFCPDKVVVVHDLKTRLSSKNSVLHIVAAKCTQCCYVSYTAGHGFTHIFVANQYAKFMNTEQ